VLRGSREQRLFVLEQLLQLLLVQRLELLVDPSAVGEPLAHRLVQSAGDIQQRPLAAMVDSQIQRTVQVAFLAAARRFAAGAGPLDQAAAHKRLLRNPLGELGTCVAFWRRALAAVVHDVSRAVLTMYYTLRTGRADKPLDECEFAPQRANHAKTIGNQQLSTTCVGSCGIAGVFLCKTLQMVAGEVRKEFKPDFESGIYRDRPKSREN
jgi:hypothetical protein